MVTAGLGGLSSFMFARHRAVVDLRGNSINSHVPRYQQRRSAIPT
jgi:hypothetical protein